MLIGLISDIHGNKVALETVLDRMKNEHDVDEIACAGDVIGVLGWPEKTCRIVQREVDYCVYGNHDSYIRSDYNYVPEHSSQKQEHRVVTSELTKESVKWLNDLPARVEITDNVVMAHGNPYIENKAGYPAHDYVNKRDWVEFSSTHMNGETVIVGHTHDQGHLDLSKFEGQSGTIVNPGSCGAPYYTDAEYALLDTKTHESSLHHVYYDEKELRDRFDQLGVKSANELNNSTY